MYIKETIRPNYICRKVISFGSYSLYKMQFIQIILNEVANYFNAFKHVKYLREISQNQ